MCITFLAVYFTPPMAVTIKVGFVPLSITNELLTDIELSCMIASVVLSKAKEVKRFYAAAKL